MPSDRWLLVIPILVLVPKSFCVVMTTESSSNQEDSGAYRSDTEKKFGDSFFQCYKDDRDSTYPCIDQSARAGLSAFFSKDNLEISEGLSLIEEEPNKDNVDDPLFRDQRPKSFVDAASAYLSTRSLRWDMSGLYPGLIMRVGPTLTAGSGVLEFAMEPTRHYTDRGVGPGRLIMRQTVVPLLLGVKVSVAALVPILLFGVVILVKKALVLSQVSAVLSAILGFGSVAAAAAAGGGYGGSVYPGGHAHIAEGLPLAIRHRYPHQITQGVLSSPYITAAVARQGASEAKTWNEYSLANGPLIVDVPPPWSNRDSFRTEESSTSNDKFPGDASVDSGASTSPGTRTQRRTKNPRGFLWEGDSSRVNGYQTSPNIFPRESE